VLTQIHCIGYKLLRWILDKTSNLGNASTFKKTYAKLYKALLQ